MNLFKSLVEIESSDNILENLRGSKSKSNMHVAFLGEWNHNVSYL